MSALLVRSHALLELKNYTEAYRTLDSAEAALKKLSQKLQAELQPSLQFMQLKLELRECDRLPTSTKLDEAQAKDQWQRKSLCVQKAFLKLQSLYVSQAAKWIDAGRKDVIQALKTFRHTSLAPPSPLETLKADELKNYQTELSSYFWEQYSGVMKELSETTVRWKSEVSPAFRESLDSLNKEIQNLKEKRSVKP